MSKITTRICPSEIKIIPCGLEERIAIDITADGKSHQYYIAAQLLFDIDRPLYDLIMNKLNNVE